MLMMLRRCCQRWTMRGVCSWAGVLVVSVGVGVKNGHQMRVLTSWVLCKWMHQGVVVGMCGGEDPPLLHTPCALHLSVPSSTPPPKWLCFLCFSAVACRWTPESVGDYASGTNHVLPTYGYARMYSGVSLDSFTKKMTVQSLTWEGLQVCGMLHASTYACCAKRGNDGNDLAARQAAVM